MKPDVTLFADASLHPQDLRAGWGAWMKGDGRQSITHYGALPFHPSIIVCELEALAEAIEHAERVEYFRASDQVVMLQSDSTASLGAILQVNRSIHVRQHGDSALVRPRKKELLPAMKAPIDRVLAATHRNGLLVLLRHVRGHTAGGGRQWVNRKCDQLAKLGRKMEMENQG